MIRSPAVALACLLLMTAAGRMTAADGVVLVRVGATVERNLDAVGKDGWTYRPRQNVDGETGETRIYMPYGNAPQLYWAASGVTLTDARPGGSAEIVSTAGDRPAALTYRLQFDKAISGFRCHAGYAELVMGPESVCGLEYSVDGKGWTTVVEHPEGTSAVVAPLVDAAKAISGLDTKSLFLRFYARRKADPSAGGAQMYLKLRSTGDPSWGDAERTFFDQQIVVSVRKRK